MNESTVTKAGFIKQLVDNYGYTKSSAKRLVSDFLETVLNDLEEGRAVYFVGFGCFDLVQRAEHAWRDPNNGRQICVPAHYVPRFYPGNTMKRVVKKWEDNEKRGLNHHGDNS